MTAGGGRGKRGREAEEADVEEEDRRVRDVRKAWERRLWEEAEERRLEAVERTWKSLGIARRLAEGHGYMDGEGGSRDGSPQRGGGRERTGICRETH